MSGRVVSLTELEYRRRIRAYGQMTNAPEALIRATTQAGIVQLRTVRKEQPRQITVPRPLVPRAPEPEPKSPPPHLQESVMGMVLTAVAAILVVGVVGVRFFHIATGGMP